MNRHDGKNYENRTAEDGTNRTEQGNDKQDGSKEPNEELNRLTHETIGAAIEVHRVLGPGFLECVYEEAFAIELALRRIAYERQVSVSVDYKGNKVGPGRMDFLIGSRLVVELKAVECFAPIHMAQVISYLKAARLPLALLINFNVPVLREGIKRIVLSRSTQLTSPR